MTVERRSNLSTEKAALVKELLMKGTAQAVVAGMVGTSQTTVSRIRSGQAHAAVPWPDGSLGPMPTITGLDRDTRRKAAEYKRWSTTADLYQKMPPPVQMRILEVVNVKRAAQALDPIPHAAPEYLDYLEQIEEVQDSEGLAGDLLRAQQAEDSRMVTLMEEFNELLLEEQAHIREMELHEILDATSVEAIHEGEDTSSYPLLYDKLPWEEVETRGYKVPIVQEAALEGNKVLQEACCITFHVLRNSPVEDWKMENVEREIRRLAARLAAGDSH